MTPEMILALIQLAGKLLETGVSLYESSKATMSETDIAKIQTALEEAQMATAKWRPLVDAALDAASKK